MCHTGIQPLKSNVFFDNSGLYANWLCLINRITYFCTQEWRSIVLGVKRKSQKCWRVNNQLTFRQIFVKILQIHKPCYITRSLEIHAKIKREFSAPKVCTSLSHLTQAVVFIQLKPFIYGIFLQNSPMMMARLTVAKEQIYFYHYKYADHCN